MDKHIVITGATGGIGREVSRLLSEQYRLTLLSRDAAKLALLKEELCARPKCNPIQYKAKAKNVSFEAQYAESTSNVPLGKYASPSEIAEIIAFFLSDRASHITGTNLVCDGGFNRGF